MSRAEAAPVTALQARRNLSGANLLQKPLYQAWLAEADPVTIKGNSSNPPSCVSKSSCCKAQSYMGVMEGAMEEKSRNEEWGRLKMRF